MSLLDDLKAAVADVDGKVDALLAAEGADQAAVLAAQAAQKDAEDKAALAEAALADAQANAVDQATVDSVKAIAAKLTPTSAPEPAPEAPPAE